MTESQHDWLDEWEEGGPEPDLDQEPIEILRRIAFAESTADSVRVQALRVLLERGGDTTTRADVEVTAQVKALSDAALDEALKDYFDPGFLSKPEASEPKVLKPLAEEAEERIAEEVERRVRERLREMAKNGALVAQRSAQDAHGSVESEQDQAPPQDAMRAERDAGVRAQFGGNGCPPGIDPEVHRMTNDLGYRRQVRRHLPPW